MRTFVVFGCLLTGFAISQTFVSAQQAPDHVRSLQLAAIESGKADWGYWGTNPEKYTGWTNHSNRLIPVYLFGGTLDAYQGRRSAYRHAERLEALYGETPAGTLNPSVDYFDQTDLFRLQRQAAADGKKYIFVVIFDGMDWQTTQAAAIYRTQRVAYTKGRGTGLSFLDYDGAPTDYGFYVTSARFGDAKPDVDRQVFQSAPDRNLGGYSAEFGGRFPWSIPGSPQYLTGSAPQMKHLVTDSASSATSIFSGIKTYNSAINMSVEGTPVSPIARALQQEGYLVGTVTSVPFCHATPAAAYANNLDRDDYQDLGRDMLGLSSVTHSEPLPGLDVVIGCGWGEIKDDDREKQGMNYVPGNKYLAESDLKKLRLEDGGKYVVVQRTAGQSGRALIEQSAERAVEQDARLLGFFGIGGGHLPYRTADGLYDPTRGEKYADKYSPADVAENPTLAEMTRAALHVLGHREASGPQKGFWLLVEPGDVDWANHNNNIDDSIGAVLSGDEAFEEIVKWIEERNCWDESLVIVTADHGHLLNLTRPEVLIRPAAEAKDESPTSPATADKSQRPE
ncbi:MAG: alkaline phosphatase [Planctomycetota bacterium]|jgi:alkaline phosphatase